MVSPSRREVKEVAEYFGVNTNFDEKLSGYPVDVYSILLPKLPPRARVYVVYSPEARALACFPHIIGKGFERLNSYLAAKSVEAIVDLAGLDGEEVVHLHVLRAGPGYQLHRGLRNKLGLLREVYIRPLYSDNRNSIEVVYSNFSSLPEASEVSVVAPDTIATGNTLIVALDQLKREAEDRGTALKKLVIYGFVADKGLNRVVRKAVELGFKEVYVFALVDIAALASNDYDMVLYGPDLSSREGKVLGGVAPLEVLERCTPYYVPGLDQPGDWSARQCWLFNGRSLERGNFEKHLKGVRAAVQKVLEEHSSQSWFKAWHKDACKRVLAAVNATYRELVRTCKYGYYQ